MNHERDCCEIVPRMRAASTRMRSSRQEGGQRHVRVDRPMLLGRSRANRGAWRDRPGAPFQYTPMTTAPTSSGTESISTISPEVTALPPATTAAAARREATPVQPPRERDEGDPFATPPINPWKKSYMQPLWTGRTKAAGRGKSVRELGVSRRGAGLPEVRELGAAGGAQQEKPLYAR